MHILESTVRPRPFQAGALWQQLESLGLSTAEDAARMVRDDRDRR